MRCPNLLIALSLLIAVPRLARAEAGKSADENTLYALGLALARDLKTLNLTAQELEPVKQGLTDGVVGNKPKVDLAKYEKQLVALTEDRIAETAKTNKAAGSAYIAKVAAEKNAQKTPSGLTYIILKQGTGQLPKLGDTVKANYEARFIDGTVFETTATKGQPIEIAVGGSIACINEGVQKIKVGGKARLVCPSSLAFGDRGNPPLIPAGATVVLEIEVLSAAKAAKPAMPLGHPGGAKMPGGHPGGAPAPAGHP
jgi:FKBP-type peptidyl-prolyl cis-trans isomerase